LRRRRGCGGSNRERFADEGSFFAVGTDFKIPAGELKQEVLPGWGGGCLFFLRFGVGWMVFICGFLLPEEGSGHFEFGFGIARSQEAIVADFDKAEGSTWRRKRRINSSAGASPACVFPESYYPWL